MPLPGDMFLLAMNRAAGRRGVSVAHLQAEARALHAELQFCIQDVLPISQGALSTSQDALPISLGPRRKGVCEAYTPPG